MLAKLPHLAGGDRDSKIVPRALQKIACRLLFHPLRQELSSANSKTLLDRISSDGAAAFKWGIIYRRCILSRKAPCQSALPVCLSSNGMMICSLLP